MSFFCSVAEGTKPADEPKFVIFYNLLVAIFQLFCFHCKWDSPSVEVHKIGTMANVIQRCDHCGRVYRWEKPANNVHKASCWECDVELWNYGIRSKKLVKLS